MPLQLDGITQDISTPAGDTGTYTWADIVALGSTKLTTITTASGKTIYRWTGKITLQGTATLNILSQTIELLGINSTSPGRIEALGSSTVNFGEVTTVSGVTVYRQGCEIICTSAYNSTAIGNAQLSYSTSSFSVTGSRINIYASSLCCNTTSGFRVKIYLSNIRASYCWANTVSSSLRNVFVLQNNATVDSSSFLYITLELNTTVTISSISSVLSDSNIVNYTSITRVALSGVKATVPTHDYLVTRSSPFDFIDSPSIVLSNGLVYRDDDYGTSTFNTRKAFNQYLKITDASGNVNNALVSYAGRTNVDITTSSNGLATATLVSEETNLSAATLPANYQTYTKPIPVVNYSSYTLVIKSYLHEPVSEAITITDTLGSSTSPFTKQLIADAGVTQTNTVTVTAYSGISHTTSTITVTQARTLNEIYDSRKLYWRNNSGVSPPYKESDVFNLGGANLVIDGVTLTSSSKFSFIETTGTVTFLNNGTVSGLIVVDSTGTLVPITISGAISGASIRVFRSPIDSYPTPLLSGTADGTGKLTGNFLYTGSDIPVIIIARLFGYIPFNDNNLVNGTITSTGLAVTVSMQTDTYI